MEETTQFTIGAEVRGTDGGLGQLKRVVVNPISKTVTHLLIEPKHRQGLGRLVPLDLVESTRGGEVRLRCTRADFDQLDFAEETSFLPGVDEAYAGYEPGDAYAWPYFGGNASVPVTSVAVPVGEVSVRRGDPVQAADGNIGKVEGLVVESRGHHVTHVLLQEGHLWGRKEVAIPIEAISSVDSGIRLKISKQEVQNLPPIDLDRAAG
jgi:sporulation protein YlmC with PRC-barrel domain